MSFWLADNCSNSFSNPFWTLESQWHPSIHQEVFLLLMTIGTRLNVGKYFFRQRVVFVRNSLPPSVVKEGSVNQFKNCLDQHWNDMGNLRHCIFTNWLITNWVQVTATWTNGYFDGHPESFDWVTTKGTKMKKSKSFYFCIGGLSSRRRLGT